MWSSRSRSYRAGALQPKGGSSHGNSTLQPKKLFMVGCVMALCCAGTVGYWKLHQAALKKDSSASSAELMKAIEEALATTSLDSASIDWAVDVRSLQPSFDALPKDSMGNINGLSAHLLLHNYFSYLGWKIDGFGAQGMRPPIPKGLSNAFDGVHALSQLVPKVAKALNEAGSMGMGFTFRHVAGLAIILKSQLLQQGSQVLPVMYKRYNLTIKENISQEALKSIVDDFMVHLNTVDGKSPDLALHDPEDLASLKADTLEFATDGFNKSKFSKHDVTSVTQNLTLAFENLYHKRHCELLTKQMVDATMLDTGRLQLAKFYGGNWNGSMNLKESKTSLRAAGVLDETNSKHQRVLVTNYMYSHLNCVRHGEYYSLCCPNQCLPIIQRIESATRSPIAEPAKLIQIIANLSILKVPSQDELALGSKLQEIASHHGGVIPLHGRLFAQWLHYAFPNDCAYPQETNIKARKWRIRKADVSKEQQDETFWATLNREFDEPSRVLRSAPWSVAEVLPLHENQVWSAHTFTVAVVIRISVFAVAVVAMIWAMWKFGIVAFSDEAVKQAMKASEFQRKLKRRAFEEKIKTKIARLRYEYSCDLVRAKGQEQTKIGMHLRPSHDASHGLIVEDILPGGLIDMRNKANTHSKSTTVTVGDHLISVNGETDRERMKEEIAKSCIGKTCLRFSRDAAKAAPLTWTAELERTDGEAWGMSLAAENSKELVISRVVPGGPVEKSNRRATRQNKLGLYPGDLIIACEPELDIKKIIAKLQKEACLNLTILRWHAASASETSGSQAQDKSSKKGEKASTKPRSGSEGSALSILQDKTSSSSEPLDVEGSQTEQHRCDCCDCIIADKYVLMRCSAEHVKYVRRTCWRQKHGGFTAQHMPRHCSCGSPIAKLEVYERSKQDSEARLVHTILDGPVEIDIAFEDAPQNEERTVLQHRRAASATRRALEGDARRRLPRVRLPGQMQDAEEEAAAEQINPPAAKPSQTAHQPSASAEQPSQSSQKPSRSVEQPCTLKQQSSSSAEQPRPSVQQAIPPAKPSRPPVEKPSPSAKQPSSSIELCVSSMPGTLREDIHKHKKQPESIKPTEADLQKKKRWGPEQSNRQSNESCLSSANISRIPDSGQSRSTVIATSTHVPKNTKVAVANVPHVDPEVETALAYASSDSSEAQIEKNPSVGSLGEEFPKLTADMFTPSAHRSHADFPKLEPKSLNANTLTCKVPSGTHCLPPALLGRPPWPLGSCHPPEEQHQDSSYQSVLNANSSAHVLFRPAVANLPEAVAPPPGLENVGSVLRGMLHSVGPPPGLAGEVAAPPTRGSVAAPPGLPMVKAPPGFPPPSLERGSVAAPPGLSMAEAPPGLPPPFNFDERDSVAAPPGLSMAETPPGLPPPSKETPLSSLPTPELTNPGPPGILLPAFSQVRAPPGLPPPPPPPGLSLPLQFPAPTTRGQLAILAARRAMDGFE